MRIPTRLLVSLALLALIVTATSPARADAVAELRAPARPKVAGPKVASRFAILVDARTGAILWRRNATTAKPPASLTKMLTAVLVRASLPLNAVAVTGRDAARAPPSKLALKPGQRITVSQALQALMVVSANDMAVLAVGVKTGFTDDAGRCLAAAATRNGRTLIAIVLHSPDPPGDAAQLMNWGFGSGRNVTTGQALPPYVAAPSVRTLLAPAPTTTVAPAGPLSPAQAATSTALGSRLARWREDKRVPVGVGGGAGAALLAGTGLVVRRRRRRGATPR